MNSLKKLFGISKKKATESETLNETLTHDSPEVLRFSTTSTTSKLSEKKAMLQRAVEKKAMHYPHDFERWFDRLEAFTFKSCILPITPEIARAMVNFHYQKFYERHLLTDNDINTLKKLEIYIEDNLDKFKSLNKIQDVFVRMSNRSPKDGIPLLKNGERISDLYDHELSSIPEHDVNARMVAVCDIQMKSLLCNNPAQIMNLLLTSDRVFRDLLLALDCQEDVDDKWSTSIILREWQPELREDLEFRLFVCKNRVTAISQYNHYCTYESLTSAGSSIDLKEVKDKLIAFSEKVSPYIGKDEYILDLAIVGDKIYVVELNPFDETTGACLFDWHLDKEILTGASGLDEIAFKIRREQMPNLSGVLSQILLQDKEQTKEDLQSYQIMLDKLQGLKFKR